MREVVRSMASETRNVRETLLESAESGNIKYEKRPAGYSWTPKVHGREEKPWFPSWDGALAADKLLFSFNGKDKWCSSSNTL